MMGKWKANQKAMHMARKMAGDKKQTRQELMLKKKWCFYCKVDLIRFRALATIDHKIPLSRGGLDAHFNRVISCVDCNRAKGSMTDKELLAVTT